MQAIILAAGKGVRMGDLCEEIPKPMLDVFGKTLLEHKLENLPQEIDEVVILVGYLGDKIKNHIGSEFQGKKISYVHQEKLLGTADGLWRAKDVLKGRFMVMMGDDIYCREDMEDCLKSPRSILVKEVDFLESGGKVVLRSDGCVENIIEGQNHNEPKAFVSTGLFVLDTDIFNLEPVKIPGRDEYGLPQTLIQAKDKFPLKVVKSRFWLQITKPEDLKKAEEVLRMKEIL